MDDLPVLVLDGGLGTSLEDKYGVRFDATTPLWSSHLLLTDAGRETLLACQRDFAQVPVDLLLTPTYQISIEGLARTRTTRFPVGVGVHAAPGILEHALATSEAAVTSHGARIALSLGPYGACMVPSQEYTGFYDVGHDSIEQLKAWHLDRIQLFTRVTGLANRVSFLAFETVPRLDEIIAIRRALDESDLLESNPELRVWISCVFPGEAIALPDGSDVAAVVGAMLNRELAISIPWGLGINCTKIGKLGAVVKAYEAALPPAPENAPDLRDSRPRLVIYPDGTNGEVYNTTTKTWEAPPESLSTPRSPWEVQLAGIVAETSNRGRWKQILVGGCCKTTHGDLERLCRQLETEGLRQSNS